MNLISNSLKFIVRGGITIKICKIFQSVEEGKEEAEYIQFKVKDTGFGIPKKHIKNLFVMFGKLKQRNLDINRQGTGLGLTIWKKLVESLGGEINLKSEIDKGTEVTFTIKNNIDPDSLLTRNKRKHALTFKEMIGNFDHICPYSISQKEYWEYKPNMVKKFESNKSWF